MRNLHIVLALVVAFSGSAFAQKGIDTQTQNIKNESNKTTARPTDVTRTFDWGKG